MDKISILFWSAVAGVVLCLAMTIYTGTRSSEPKSAPHVVVPTPATLPGT